MDKPIQDFSDCHVGIVNTLDDLTALSRQRSPVPQRSEVAGRILHFFRDVVMVHHNEEEAELFSGVLADSTAGDERESVQALVDRLKGEHRHVERLFAPLASTLAAIQKGGDVTLDASAVEILVTYYRVHAQFEENVFLPLAQSILGRNSHHMAGLGLALHFRHAPKDLRRKFGFI